MKPKDALISTVRPEDDLAARDALCERERISRRKFIRRAVLQHITSTQAELAEREAALALYRASKETGS